MNLIIGAERETRRRAARKVARTARRAGSMVTYGGGIGASCIYAPWLALCGSAEGMDVGRNGEGND